MNIFCSIKDTFSINFDNLEEQITSFHNQRKGRGATEQVRLRTRTRSRRVLSCQCMAAYVSVTVFTMSFVHSTPCIVF